MEYDKIKMNKYEYWSVFKFLDLYEVINFKDCSKQSYKYFNEYIESILDRDPNCKVSVPKTIPLNWLTYVVETYHLLVTDNLLELVAKTGDMEKNKSCSWTWCQK